MIKSLSLKLKKIFNPEKFLKNFIGNIEDITDTYGLKVIQDRNGDEVNLKVKLIRKEKTKIIDVEFEEKQ